MAFLCSLCKMQLQEGEAFPTYRLESFLPVLSHKTGFCLPVGLSFKTSAFLPQQQLFTACRPVGNVSSENGPVLKSFLFAENSSQDKGFRKIVKGRWTSKEIFTITRIGILTKIYVLTFVNTHDHFMQKYSMRNIIS